MPYVPTRDIITYYEETGRGEPLVLIRGLGSDLQAWATQVPDLAKHFRVITYDNRGAGRTGAPDKPYSLSGMADDLAALLEALKVEQAHILGYSMGGMIAQEFALKYANRVDKLILLGTSAGLDGYSRVVLQNMVNVRRSNMSREQLVRNTAPFIYSAALLDDGDAGLVRGGVDENFFVHVCGRSSLAVSYRGKPMIPEQLPSIRRTNASAAPWMP